MFIWVQNHWHWFAGYLAAASTAGFLLMGSDKARAKKGSWRIPEKTFFWCSAAGRYTRLLGRHVSVPPQNPALVFSLGNTADPSFSDLHCGLDYPLYGPPLLMGSVMVLNISS